VFLPAAHALTSRLIGVSLSGIPVISEDRLIYTIEFSFSKKPEYYWYYNDTDRNRLIIDCYGMKILNEAPAKLGMGIPFGAFDIENRESSLSISGKQALIVMNVEPGWTFKEVGDSTNSKSIFISAIKEMKHPKIEKPQRRRTLLYTKVVIGTVTATIATIILFSVLSR
jgi:hypothetical protein